MPYDFRAARQRIQQLTFMYRRAKHQGEDDLTLMALAAEIEEIEREVSEAHKAKTTAGTVA